MYATPTRFIQFDTWAELEAPGIADLPKVLMSHGYTTISSGKIYHMRLDIEHSWNEICGFGIVSQPSPYRRCVTFKHSVSKHPSDALDYSLPQVTIAR